MISSSTQTPCDVPMKLFSCSIEVDRDENGKRGEDGGDIISSGK